MKRLALALLAVAPLAAPAARARELDASGFEIATAPYVFSFPRDHAAHPGYRTEWWYYTGHLRSGTRRFGYEVTFFRAGLPRTSAASPSAWAARDLVFLHLALTDESRGRFLHHESARRAALGFAGADSTRMHVWLDDAQLAFDADGRTHRLRGRAPEFALDLALTPDKPLVAHGAGGVSRKGAARGDASHYVSFTRLRTRGRLVADGNTLAVEGSSWMDHEYASNPAPPTHSGWDWFGLQLDDGRELMLYRLRLPGGAIEPFSQGTLIGRDGRTRTLALADFSVTPTGAWTSPHSGARYPSGWLVRVPSEDLTLTITPTVADQELTVASMGGLVYWEGSVRIASLCRGVTGAGQGYAELTGYAGPSPP